MADIFGLPVSRVQTNETSSLGAAIAGFLAIKEYGSQESAVKGMVRVADTFYPRTKEHHIYNKLFNEGYLKLYPSLKETYKMLWNYSQN
jgi:sugar (pentulose or hexulose) kinase